MQQFLVENNVSLRHFNTFGIDASAALFTTIHNEEEIKALIAEGMFRKNKFLILGGGSNILFTQDFEGLVVKDEIAGIEVIREDEAHVWIRSGGGEIWHRLVLFCIDGNLAGIENLSLIPGSVGAAPIQNIGAYGVELKEVLDTVEAINLATGKTEFFENKDCSFGYRDSIFKHALKNRLFITRVVLKLKKEPVFTTSYGAITETLKQMGIHELSVKAISDAVIHIRQSKLPDPKEIGNAGSFFKNPEIEIAAYQELKNKFPGMPGYPSKDKIKIPAGWLIEQCGWKGKRIGNTGAHKDQALVLVNYGNATGNEIYELALKIKKSVHDSFGIEINPEVNII